MFIPSIKLNALIIVTIQSVIRIKFNQGICNSIEEKVILDKYSIVEASRTRTVYNWLQYFIPETLEREFTECGLAVDQLFSDVADSPYNPESTEFAVVAKKP